MILISSQGQNQGEIALRLLLVERCVFQAKVAKGNKPPKDPAACVVATWEKTVNVLL